MEEKDKQPLTPPAPYQPSTYAPPTPTAAYEGSDQAAIMQQMIADYVNRTDPQAQAEQDAKMQRGRQFWTGANLFANVVANAINASGTAKGAPNMTWNDSASQKMYDTWQNADKELKAERRAAQQRLDALRLQDAQFRMSDKQAQDRADLEAYKTRFGLENEAAKANWSRQVKEYETQEARDRDDAIRKENQAFQEKLAKMRLYGGGGSGRTSTKAATDHSVQLGSIDIPAKDEKEAQRIRRDVANKIVDRMNAEIEKRNKGKKINEQKEDLIAKPKNDEEAQAIIYQNGGLYDDDTDFRKDINGTYGIEDIYAEEEEQFAGHSVRPDESSLPDPRRYAGTAQNQTPRAYRGNPVTWNSAPAIRGEAVSRYFKDSAGNMFSSDRWGDVYVYQPKGNGEGTWELFGKRGDINAEQVKKQGTDINLDEINSIADEKDRNYSTGGKGNAGKVKFNFG